MSAPVIRGLARILRAGRPARVEERDAPRILVIRRNRMGDMICTLPLFRALRRQWPHAHLAVACDAPGRPIAKACSAVGHVVTLRSGWNRWAAQVIDARGLQDFDVVIAAKVGFDERLATLARLTNAKRRIGYEDGPDSAFYTDPVPIPTDHWHIHQIEATLGLLAPLGVAGPADPASDLGLDIPAEALAFADSRSSFWRNRKLVLVNLSSTSRLRFRDEDFAVLVAELASRADLALGLVCLPEDHRRAGRIAQESAGQIRLLATPGPMELAALLSRAHLLITGEGGAAHLAASTATPAVVLWSQGPFQKWKSRGRQHTFVRAVKGEALIPIARVREALEPHL